MVLSASREECALLRHKRREARGAWDIVTICKDFGRYDSMLYDILDRSLVDKSRE